MIIGWCSPFMLTYCMLVKHPMVLEQVGAEEEDGTCIDKDAHSRRGEPPCSSSRGHGFMVPQPATITNNTATELTASSLISVLSSGDPPAPFFSAFSFSPGSIQHCHSQAIVAPRPVTYLGEKNLAGKVPEPVAFHEE